MSLLSYCYVITDAYASNVDRCEKQLLQQRVPVPELLIRTSVGRKYDVDDDVGDFEV